MGGAAGSFRHFPCLQLYEITLAPPLIQSRHRWPGRNSAALVPLTPVHPNHRVTCVTQSVYDEAPQVQGDRKWGNTGLLFDLSNEITVRY